MQKTELTGEACEIPGQKFDSSKMRFESEQMAKTWQTAYAQFEGIARVAMQHQGGQGKALSVNPLTKRVESRMENP